LIEISQEIKTLDLFKSIIRKAISNFLVFLEELICENKISKYYFVFIQILGKHICKGNIIQNDIYQIKFAMPKACLKINSKYYFYKVYALILKGLFSSHIFYYAT
jgi:hypothetical protein